MTLLKKKINLDLSLVPISRHAEVKREVGEYLINQVLKDIERGFSPVEGHGKFPLLTEKYADKEKGGRRTSNLQLDGDLKEAIKFRPTSEGIEFGNFDASQFDKADGHNQHSSKAKKWAAAIDFPQRRYIPDDSENFRQGIQNDIEKIVSEYKTTDVDGRALALSQFEVALAEEEIATRTISLDASLSDAVIEAEIRRQLDLE